MAREPLEARAIVEASGSLRASALVSVSILGLEPSVTTVAGIQPVTVVCESERQCRIYGTSTRLPSQAHRGYGHRPSVVPRDCVPGVCASVAGGTVNPARHDEPPLSSGDAALDWTDAAASPRRRTRSSGGSCDSNNAPGMTPGRSTTATLGYQLRADPAVAHVHNYAPLCHGA